MSLAIQHYPLFIAAAATAIVTPGPGVMLAISNGLRFGVLPAQGGILGIACGSLLMALASASGLGLLLAASPRAWTALQLLGAAYLGYLGLRLLRREGSAAKASESTQLGVRPRFVEGLTLQLGNPQAMLFFGAILPQFIDYDGAAPIQFAVLIGSYAVLLFLIHSGYAAAASRAAALLATPRARHALFAASGVAFIGFALILLWRVLGTLIGQSGSD